MEITLTGFNPSFNSATSVEVNRQQQRQQQNAQQGAGTGRDSAEKNANSSRSEATSRTQQTARSSRIFNGEVLASESERVNSGARSSVFELRSPDTQQSPNGQPDFRRVSVQQAIQTFQDNQELVTEEDRPRQVSGIIDEFV